MGRKIGIIIIGLCLVLFAGAINWSQDIQAASDAPECSCKGGGDCKCGADCKCDHCAQIKGKGEAPACKCKGSGKGCSCGENCKCDHCMAGKGKACNCKGGKGGCECGKDCKCGHCSGKAKACNCKGGKGKSGCACGKDCKCGHCSGKGKACNCKGGKGKSGCACGKDCKCGHCSGKGKTCNCKGGKGGCECGKDCKCGHCKLSTEEAAAKPTSEADYASSRLSGAGIFKVSYVSEPAVVPVNQIHSWKLKVETAEGIAVKDAEITVEGDMPEHGHGLPTQPKMTQSSGDGTYLIEGIKFSMPGWWVMKFQVKAGNASDAVTFNLQLK
ncbi:MAG: FixH family protein [Thermodesulfovibrionales bacterium]